MANNKAQAFVIHTGGTSTEYPVLDMETYESLVSAILRIARLENTSESHDTLLAAVQEAVAKLQATDSDAAQTLQDLDARITRAQNTADSNTSKYQALSETVTNEQTKLADEIRRAQDVEGDISDLNTVVRDNLVAAINYILTRAEKNAESIGSLSDLETSEKTDIVKAINELETLKADQSDIDTALATVDNAMTRVETLENSVNNAVAEVTSAVDSVNTAVQRVDAMQTTVGTYDAAIAAKADKATTLEGYGITDGLTASDVNIMEPLTVTTAPSAVGQNDIAIGNSAVSSSPNSIAIGAAARANATGTVAIGADSNANGSSPTVAIGQNTAATGSIAIAVGYSAKASGDVSTALGSQTTALAKSVAVGYGAQANSSNAVALGNNSATDEDNTVSVGSSSLQRRIVNVADPTGDQDAATKAYVDNHTGRGKVRVPIDGVFEASCGEYKFSFSAIYKENYEYELVEATNNIINTVTKTISDGQITISGTLRVDDTVKLKMYKCI